MAGISKRVSGAWVSGSERIMKTATDTITPPTTIYADGTNATVSLKGNMVQSGTPTPQNPVDVEGVGELETSGEHAGQFKIPILSNSITTNVYLGEVQSTRRIKKLVLTGNEGFAPYSFENTNGIIVANMLNSNYFRANGKCSHYTVSTSSVKNTLWIGVNNSNLYFVGILTALGIEYNQFASWVAQQYANGTPVTVWYVLATPTTGIVNEPLRKIGDYADTVSDITIPTIAGADTLSVDTTLQPSEVTATYHGWHEGTVHERDNGAWD